MNPDKPVRHFDTERMKDAIERNLAGLNIQNVVVLISSDFVVNVAAEHDCKFLIRGIRDTQDWIHEETLAAQNRLLNPSIDTIYLPAHSIVSSSFVRTLYDHDCDVSGYVPRLILQAMNQQK
jgi:pantetheine-phosphate adenylyltransferase